MESRRDRRAHGVEYRAHQAIKIQQNQYVRVEQEAERVLERFAGTGQRGSGSELGGAPPNEREDRARDGGRGDAAVADEGAEGFGEEAI